MNEQIWNSIREYIAAEIELGLRRQIHYASWQPPEGHTRHEARVVELEAQSTRMETAIREGLAVSASGEPRG